jgi:hypothetical protein
LFFLLRFASSPSPYSFSPISDPGRALRLF